MRGLLRRAGLLVLVGLCHTGCGSDDDAQTDQLGARFCGLLKPCCQAAGFPESDQALCKFAFSAPKDAAAAEACISEYEQRAQAADWCNHFDDPEPASCAVAWPPQETPGGTAKLGEPCNFVGDCAKPANGEANCNFEEGQSVCIAVISVGLGEPCAATQHSNFTEFDHSTGGALEVGVCEIEQGLFCSSGTCAAIAQAGGACSVPWSCVEGTYCHEGSCKHQGGAGASCADGPSACDAASHCDWMNDVCVPRLPDGSACESDQQCHSSFCDSETKQCEPLSSGGGLLLSLMCA